ncbi:MAG TPA: hypothetical protein VKA46_40130 [Gemmataceae bacterium]|nr:hypothetical protein [Gemmataceae bacterium]
MLGAVNAVDSQNLLALNAANLAKLQTLSAISDSAAGAVGAGSPVGQAGTDLYIPSLSPAAIASTYNRFGQLDGLSANGATLPGLLIDNLRQRALVSAFTVAQATDAYQLVNAQGSQAP